MSDRTIKWLVTTCFIGLIPVVERAWVWMLFKTGVNLVSVSDLISFGLVLHAVNLQAISSANQQSSSWKTVQNGLTILFLVIYSSALFAVVIESENLNQSALLWSTLSLNVISFGQGWSVFYERRLTNDLRRELQCNE